MENIVVFVSVQSSRLLSIAPGVYFWDNWMCCALCDERIVE
jgi:hypothetical protein